mmetsp:Transcript_18661/g.51052  ORF Transcript_18661/g.51052 Transcript_18661/m.51052 type:complete len:209 (+) Transcript_18661:730-1356(+)
MNQLFHSFRGSMPTPHTGIFISTCQTNQTVRKSASIAVHCKFGVARAQNNAAPPTRRGALFAHSSPAEFAGQQRRTGSANHLTTIFALIHFIARPTVKGIAPIADPNFVIGLIFVTPVTILANKGSAFVAPNLDAGGSRIAMKTRVVLIVQIDHIVVVICRIIIIVVVVVIVFIIVVAVQIGNSRTNGGTNELLGLVLQDSIRWVHFG